MAFRDHGYCFDRVFYSGQLSRLSAVELHIDKLMPSFKVQIHSYLKCLT